MRRFDRHHHGLAIGLAVLAGMVDAIGFLRLGGLFISFMSGNSTRLAVEAAGLTAGVALAAGLIACFVGGVVLGAMASRLGGGHRMSVVLAASLMLLLLAAVVAAMTPGMATPLLMAAAMGAANNVFLQDGEVAIGVTYMTGALVKFGQHLATALCGGPRWGWLPYLLLWSGLAAGAVGGALLFGALGLRALWVATSYASVLLLAAMWTERRGRGAPPR